MIGFQLKRVAKAGLKSLWLHKLRSGLTALGIVLGVCSVMTMLAIGTGASEEAQEQIMKLGSHNIILQSVEPPENESGTQVTSRIRQFGITHQDHRRIKKLPNISLTVPARRVRKSCSRGSNRIESVDFVGTVPAYAEVNDVTVLRGTFLKDIHMQKRAAVCVLGKDTARKLFPLGDALGSYIIRGELRFRVVGIITSFARGELGGQEIKGDPNSEIYIPLETLNVVFGEKTDVQGSRIVEEVQLHELIVRIDKLEDIHFTELLIRRILEQSHDKEDYRVIVPYALLLQTRRTKRIFSIVLFAIGAISLLVGGIGIMNITLATVLERTREIGIRRAMGAKRRHIIFQFLAETVMLALFGGVLGVVIGLVVPFLVEKFSGMRTVVTMLSIVMSFGISAAVGVIFGIYPAYRAAHMDPIDALRHE